MIICKDRPRVNALVVTTALATLAATSTLPVQASEVAVTPAAGAVPVRWRQVYEQPDAEIEHLAGTVGADGNLWLVVGQRDDGVLSGPHRLELWRIGAADGQRTRMPLVWDGAPAIGSQRPMHMLALRGGVAIALQTDSGAHIVMRGPDAGPVVFGPVTASGDTAILALGTDTAGQPALLTVSGLVSLDESGRSWLLRWKKPDDRLIVAAVAAGPGRFGLVSTRLDDAPGNLALVAVDVPAEGAVSTRMAPLPRGNPHALGKSLVALDRGGFALADPFAMEGGARWQLTTVDSDLNIAASGVTELQGAGLFRARLHNWGGTLLLLSPAHGNFGGAAFVADGDGRLSRLALQRESIPAWRNTTRLDLYPLAGGDALLVESAHVLDDGARTTRLRVSVTRLSRDAVAATAAGNRRHREGDRP